MRLVYSVLALLFTISGCSIAENRSTLEKTGLPGEFFNTEWQLVRFSGIELTEETLQADETPLLIFGLEESRVFGTGGCNRFSGAYLPGDGATLSFGNIVSTRIACADQEPETEFFNRLKKVTLYRFNEDFTELSLLNSEGEVLLVFKKTRFRRT